MDALLKLISNDARLTHAQLAAMLGITEADVAARIAQLERAGVIRGYRAVVDWHKTEREYVTAVIELKVTPRRDSGFEAIAESIARLDEVESVCLMSGGFDLLVTVGGRTFQDVALFVAKRLSTLESVVSTATHFVLRQYKESGIPFEAEHKDERGAL